MTRRIVGEQQKLVRPRPLAVGARGLSAMSLASFQSALADLAASPALGAAARADESVFDRYELTARERRRLSDVIRQGSLATHCALDRAQRLAPLQALLGGTCFLLGDRLGAVADAFWETPAEGQCPHSPEAERFAAFLQARVAAGELWDPYLEEILAFELALHELKLAPPVRGAADEARLWGEDASGLVLDPRVRLLTFQHDPAELLGHIAQGARPARPLPAGLHFLLMRAEGDRVSFETLDPGLGEAAQTVKLGATADLSRAERVRLVEAGLAVSCP